MLILLNALQAGNRSGTGRYVEALAQWLPQVPSSLSYAFFWPRHVPHPPRAQFASAAFLDQDAQPAWRRLWIDHYGMRREAARSGANLVHYPANIGPLVEMPNAVVTIHDLTFFRNPGWFRPGRALYYRKAAAVGARRAARIIADSQASATDIQTYLGIDADRIDVIPLGVDPAFGPAGPEQVAAVRRKYGLGRPFILYMGTLEPRKNLPRLIEAWEQSAAGDADLALVGRRGWKTAALDAAIAASPHRDRIHLPGFVPMEDQAALYSACEAFVWPALAEGFGLPVLEGMACGAPVLTSNRSSLPEVTGDAALLANPEDADAIAEGINRILSDSALRARLKAAGPLRAAHFTWRRTAELTVASYRRALSL